MIGTTLLASAGFGEVAAALWLIVILAAALTAGRVGVGFLLTWSYAVEVVPAIWTAWTTAAPTFVLDGDVLGGEVRGGWFVRTDRPSDPRRDMGVSGSRSTRPVVTWSVARSSQAAQSTPDIWAPHADGRTAPEACRLVPRPSATRPGR